MNNLAKLIGQRLRNYRTQQNLSQEKLAEMSGCHPTYIGQLERGEKNATIESIEKIASALKIPLSQLFEKIDCNDPKETAASKCYELIASKPISDQEQIFKILSEIEAYKKS